MYNKVEYNGETLINLTDTTATENDVVQGKKFHDRSGALRNGNLVIPTYTAGAGIDITAGEISAKVDGTTIKTNANGELEVKPDVYEEKKTWTKLLTATTTEDAVFQLDDTSAGVDLNGYSEVQVMFELPTGTTTYPKYSWYYNGAYGTGVNCTVASTNFRWWTLNAKKVNSLWWIESRVSDTTDRLGYLFKNIYRENITNVVMESFEGMRFYLTSTSNMPSGTKIRIWGLK